MLPYIEQPVITIAGWTFSAFGLLAALSAYTGVGLVRWQAPRYNIERDRATVLTIWTILSGFVVSHLFATLAYYPGRVLENPLELLNFWGPMSSFGGILGGVAGAAILLRLQRWPATDALRYVDMVAWAFPFAWLIARLGCALAHDHLGIKSDAFIAVNFPEGPRLDLGLIEWLLTIPVAVVFLALRRKIRPAGFYIALFFSLYGPMRLLLDSFRVGDIRYLGLTPAQYLAVALSLMGVFGLLYLLRNRAKAD